MKRILSVIMLFLVGLSSSIVYAEDTGKKSVLGGFEMAGYINAGFGWQRFSKDPVTEAAYDTSYAGVLGSIIPDNLPNPGQQYIQAFTEVAELDVIKQLGKRASLRADILFGRPNSGSWVGNLAEVEQAYLTVLLSDKYDVELTIGRYTTQPGLEPVEPYNLETISWSILTRAVLYPYAATGAQVSISPSDFFSIYIAAVNDLMNNGAPMINDVPSFMSSLVFNWGSDPHKSTFILTPYLGPQLESNHHWTFAIDGTLKYWMTDSFQLGIEGNIRRDNADGGVNTNYAAGLLDLRWDMAEDWYGVFKYAYARQFEEGTGVLNLTGAKQQIHELSLGFGHYISETVKLKGEGRFDIIAPDNGAKQTVPGVAIALACMF